MYVYFFLSGRAGLNEYFRWKLLFSAVYFVAQVYTLLFCHTEIQLSVSFDIPAYREFLNVSKVPVMQLHPTTTLHESLFKCKRPRTRL